MMHLTADLRNRQAQRKWEFAVLAIFRNEAHVLDEWLRHYFYFGAEHVYLIDNCSDDGFDEIVAPHMAAGRVSLFRCEKTGYQIGAYTEMLPRLREECEWIGVFDLDEFIYAPDGQPITRTLQRFSSYESVLIPWLSFGSSGHLSQPGSVVDGFVRRGPAQVSRSFLKAISRPDAITYFSQHNPTTRTGNKILANGMPADDELFILLNEDQVPHFALLNNHYRLQSRDYFTRVKTARPEVHEDVKDRMKKISFFDENDRYWNAVADTGLRDIHAGAAYRRWQPMAVLGGNSAGSRSRYNSRPKETIDEANVHHTAHCAPPA